jgi:hypothetical protein
VKRRLWRHLPSFAAVLFVTAGATGCGEGERDQSGSPAGAADPTPHRVSERVAAYVEDQCGQPAKCEVMAGGDPSRARTIDRDLAGGPTPTICFVGRGDPDEQAVYEATYGPNENVQARPSQTFGSLPASLVCQAAQLIELCVSPGDASASGESPFEGEEEGPGSDESPAATDCPGIASMTDGVTCEEAQSVIERYHRGEGVVYGDSTAEGDTVGEWTCSGARMGNGSTCSRGDASFEADDAIE